MRSGFGPTFRSITAGMFVLLFATPLFAQRVLVIDYELNPPDFSNELIRRVAAAGWTVDHRQYYPLGCQLLDAYTRRTRPQR